MKRVKFFCTLAQSRNDEAPLLPFAFSIPSLPSLARLIFSASLSHWKFWILSKISHTLFQPAGHAAIYALPIIETISNVLHTVHASTSTGEQCLFLQLRLSCDTSAVDTSIVQATVSSDATHQPQFEGSVCCRAQ